MGQAKETRTIEIEVQISWWFRWIYWPIVKLSFCIATLLGFEAYANEKRLMFWLNRSIKITTPKGRNGRLPAQETIHYD